MTANLQNMDEGNLCRPFEYGQLIAIDSHYQTKSGHDDM